MVLIVVTTDILLNINNIDNPTNSIIIEAIHNMENQILCHSAYSGGYPFSISGDIRSVPS